MSNRQKRGRVRLPPIYPYVIAAITRQINQTETSRVIATKLRLLLEDQRLTLIGLLMRLMRLLLRTAWRMRSSLLTGC